jgi:acetyl esterase/lipase
MVGFTQRLDPELAAALREMPAERVMDWNDLPATRELVAQMFAQTNVGSPDSEKVLREDRMIPGPQGAPEVPIRVYRPAGDSGALSGLLWIPGGGYVMDTVEREDLVARHIVEEVGCVVICVQYRLAPEHPFPAPVEDCYAVLRWSAEGATDLGIDSDSLAVGGASAGGGLAAGLALLARDRGEFNVSFQLLVYPMIDDRNVTPSSYEITDTRVWNREANLFGWNSYLGGEAGGENVSHYAAATRATDLSHLPTVYIAVGTQDLLVDENVEYAQRLMREGVPTELHVYPGAFHGSDAAVPGASISQRFIADRDEALRSAFTPPGA